MFHVKQLLLIYLNEGVEAWIFESRIVLSPIGEFARSFLFDVRFILFLV
jgi:hypothetical protein